MIRKFKSKDLDSLLEVWQSASELAHPFLSESFLVQERENIAKIHLPHAETWVFEEKGAVIAFIALLENEVGGLFVDPRHHRRGIGKALVKKAMELRGALEVEVFQANSIGRAFYSKYGFVALEEKTDDRTNFKLLRLRSPLLP